jgi:hypothetical protein
MSSENDKLKPLELGFDDDNNINNEHYTNEISEEFVPISDPSTTEIKNKESNFVFFFGVGESGKSVILSSMLYYFKTKAGDLKPSLRVPNSKEADVLLYDFFENISKGNLPNRTTRDQVTRIDLVFEPNNKSKKVPPINLTFLETSGENHNEIRRGGAYHNSIEYYLNADIPLNFIIVTSYDKAHLEDALIDTFLNELINKGKKLEMINIILVVSKWDKSGRSKVADEEELENFITQRLPMTNNRIDTHRLSKTYFTIGKIEQTSNGEKIKVLDLTPAGILSNWLYESITGYPIDYEGTFWERIKFSFKI